MQGLLALNKYLLLIAYIATDVFRAMNTINVHFQISQEVKHSSALVTLVLSVRRNRSRGCVGFDHVRIEILIDFLANLTPM